MVQEGTNIQKGGCLWTQLLKADCPCCINCPLIVIYFLWMVLIFLQKCTLMLLVQFQIASKATLRLGDICTSLDYSQCKVMKFLYINN